MMFRRRTIFFPLLVVIAVVCGCNSDPGPVVPSAVEKPRTEGAAAPAVKTSEGDRGLSTREPEQGGPPTKAVP